MPKITVPVTVYLSKEKAEFYKTYPASVRLKSILKALRDTPYEIRYVSIETYHAAIKSLAPLTTGLSLVILPTFIPVLWVDVHSGSIIFQTGLAKQEDYFGWNVSFLRMALRGYPFRIFVCSSYNTIARFLLDFALCRDVIDIKYTRLMAKRIKRMNLPLEYKKKLMQIVRIKQTWLLQHLTEEEVARRNQTIVFNNKLMPVTEVMNGESIPLL